MTPKIFDFVIQYQHSEGLRMSISYAVELLAKEREQAEAEINLFTPLAPRNPAIAEILVVLNGDMQKIEQAEDILARLSYRADTGAWKVHA